MKKKIIAIFSSLALTVAGIPVVAAAQTYAPGMMSTRGNNGSAMFSLVPQSVSGKMNQLVAVDFLLNTGMPVTSFQTSLTYDPTMLSVAGIDTVSSEFPYWWDTTHVKESGSLARINLQGSAPLPGISGDKVRVAKITFRTVRPGTAAVSMAPGSIVLNATDENVLSNGNVQTTIAITDGETPGGFSSFTRNLQIGNMGADVEALQQFLNSQGFLVAGAGAGMKQITSDC